MASKFYSLFLVETPPKVKMQDDQVLDYLKIRLTDCEQLSMLCV